MAKVICEQHGTASRLCPLCGNLLIYTGRCARLNCISAERGNQSCRSCVRKKKVGELNPFFGKKHNDQTKATIGSKNKEHQPRIWSQEMRFRRSLW